MGIEMRVFGANDVCPCWSFAGYFIFICFIYYILLLLKLQVILVLGLTYYCCHIVVFSIGGSYFIFHEKHSLAFQGVNHKTDRLIYKTFHRYFDMIILYYWPPPQNYGVVSNIIIKIPPPAHFSCWVVSKYQLMFVIV